MAGVRDGNSQYFLNFSGSPEFFRFFCKSEIYVFPMWNTEILPIGLRYMWYAASKSIWFYMVVYGGIWWYAGYILQGMRPPYIWYASIYMVVYGTI